MSLACQAGLLTGIVIVAIALSLPGLMMAIKGWPNAGWPMRLVWLISLQVHMHATIALATTLAVDRLRS